MEMATIYGAITLKEDYVGSTEFIKSLKKDLMFPHISASDFGIGDYNDYFHNGVLMYDYSWDNMIVSYAQTTSAAILDAWYFRVFVLKFEHILRNIDFDTAVLHVNSLWEEIDLFWEKRNDKKPREDELTLQTHEWSFGYGNRSIDGYLKEPDISAITSLKDHPYPTRFNEDFVKQFFDSMTQLLIVKQQYQVSRPELEASLGGPNIELSCIISYLSFKKYLEVIRMEGDVEGVKILRHDKMESRYLYT